MNQQNFSDILTYNHNEVVQAVMDDLAKTENEIKNLTFLQVTCHFSFFEFYNYIHIEKTGI